MRMRGHAGLRVPAARARWLDAVWRHAVLKSSAVGSGRRVHDGTQAGLSSRLSRGSLARSSAHAELIGLPLDVPAQPRPPHDLAFVGQHADRALDSIAAHLKLVRDQPDVQAGTGGSSLPSIRAVSAV